MHISKVKHFLSKCHCAQVRRKHHVLVEHENLHVVNNVQDVPRVTTMRKKNVVCVFRQKADV